MITVRINANWEKGEVGPRIQTGNGQEGSEETGAGPGRGESAKPCLVREWLAALAEYLIRVGRLVAKKQGLCFDGIGCQVEGDFDADPDSAVSSACKAVRMIMSIRSEEGDARLDKWSREVERLCPTGDSALFGGMELCACAQTDVFSNN